MIKSILIAGGGSAGWIAANVLNAIINKDPAHNIDITVIESPNIPSVGVGEATVPSIRKTLQLIGLPEREFMRKTDATFKNLIRFNNWNEGMSFDHPFDQRARPETDMGVRKWAASQSAPESFAKQVSVLSHLSDAGRAPKLADWPEYGSPFPYAYHLDAVKFAAYLSKWGQARGIKNTLQNIIDVQHSSHGDIASIQTEDGTSHSADLYIDCTGFAGILTRTFPDNPMRDFSRYLLCDRAVTLRVPYDIYKPKEMRPFTTSTAGSSGWTWDIGLQNRRGIGYVYASAFQSSSEAEAELRAGEGPHAQDIEAKHIKFKSQKREAAWTGNCVAIGLSDGFLEPLESSGLYMIEFAAQALADSLPVSKSAWPAFRQAFNAQMNGLYDEVLEYLNLHYVTSARRDTAFWKAATDMNAVLPSLVDKLKLWKHRVPTDLDFTRNQRLFSLESYEYILFGMGIHPIHKQAASAQKLDISDMVTKSLAKLPPHERVLSQMMPS